VNGPAGAWPGRIFLALRLLLGAVFVLSGFTKLLAPAEELALTMESYRLVPVSVTLPAARVLPWIELVAAVFLIVDLWRRAAAAVIAAMLALFVAALSSVLVRGIDIGGCGCFGAAGPKLTPGQALMLDAGFLAAALILAFKREGQHEENHPHPAH
jgi:putative oxidoreductase